MDAENFDAIARALAATGPRRRALGSLLATVSALLGSERLVSAKRKRHQERKKRKKVNHRSGVDASAKKRGKGKGNKKDKGKKNKNHKRDRPPASTPTPPTGCPAGHTACGATCCSPDTVCIADQGLCIPRDLNACITTGATCENQLQCTVATGEICCVHQCANPMCDSGNCGRCGKRCASNERCLFGVCYTPGGTCPPATTPCGTTCCGVIQQCDNGGCVNPPGLDLVPSTVCTDPPNVDCSLQFVLEPPHLGHCVTAIGSAVLKPLLAALRLPEIVDALNLIELGSDGIDVATANTNLKFIAAGLDFVLPVDCIVAIADLLSRGQYQALQLCLADEPCTRELTKALLGTDDICFGRDCAEVADACNDGICLNGVCTALPKPNGTTCGDEGGTCLDGECRPPNPCPGANCPYAFRAMWGRGGTGDGDFAYAPSGLAIDDTGNVYVGSCEVMEFTRDGRFLTRWGRESSCFLETIPHGELVTGGRLAVGPDGYVYAEGYRFTPSGGSEDWILKFTSDGRLVTQWGGRRQDADDDGKFYSILGIAVDLSGIVYVSDGFNFEGRIQRFDSDGRFLGKWILQASDDWPPPMGSIAVDSTGNLFVGTSQNVMKFDGAGGFL